MSTNAYIINNIYNISVARCKTADIIFMLKLTKKRLTNIF